MKNLVSWIIRHLPRPWLQRLGGAGAGFLGVFYRGHGVTCPVCGHSFRRFLPYGRLRARSNALCPQCLSLERHRLLWLYLKNRTSFFHHPQDVLHIAPEVCFLKPFRAIHGDRYVTADLDSPWASIKMDIHAMPFPDNSFDVVLCNHVLEHVADDILALREIRRVLRPGGYAVLQVPFFEPVPATTVEDPAVVLPRDREKLYGQSDHVRRYGADYLNRIALAGLLAEEIPYGEELGEDLCRSTGVVLSEKIFIGRK
jgi:SAM-dependent methyltransferase